MHVCLGTTPALQGTMLFPRIAPGEVNRATKVFFHASGKSINVARVLHTLGEPAKLLVPLGGQTGRIALEDLKKSALKFKCVRTSAETRTCITTIDQSRHQATEFVEESPNLSADEITALKNDFLRSLRTAELVILSGSLAAGVPETFYADCAAAANGRGVRVILDARANPMLRALKHHPLIVKPNRHELSDTLNKPLETQQSLKRAMTHLCRNGAQWAIVTQGKQGALATNGKEFWLIPPIKITPISPIGSGDAFAAGLACAIRHGQEIPQACLLATAAAAANALTPGAGRLRLTDIRKLLPLARIRKI